MNSHRYPDLQSTYQIGQLASLRGGQMRLDSAGPVSHRKINHFLACTAGMFTAGVVSAVGVALWFF